MTAGVRELFGPLLGNWAGTEEQAASPWAPASSTRAMVVFKLDVADSVVVQDYRQVRTDGGEFTAHGVFLTAPGTTDVLWWLFDSYAQPPEPASGGWVDDVLTLVKQTPRGSAEHRFAVGADRLDYRITLRLTGAEPVDFLHGTYGRVSGH